MRCRSTKHHPAGKSLISRLRSGDNLDPMITLVLHLLRLLPFLFGGHRQLALENLALRQQVAVYKENVSPAQASYDRSPFLGLAGQGLGRVEGTSVDCDS
jgi:hypothetical protein